MRQLFFILTASLAFTACSNQTDTNSTVDNSIDTTKYLVKTTEAEPDFYKDSVFYNQNSGNYHYRNVRYFFDDIGMSPVSLRGLLVKETKEVKGSNQSEGQITTISLDIMTDEKKLIGGKTFKKDCDEAKLYSHFIETVTFSPGGGWDNIELYKYDNYSNPFLTSDEEYWFFNMNSNNQHISKNCFFVTLEKFTSGNVCVLKLSDMGGVLQKVTVKNANEKDREIEFYYPQITFISTNPFQYQYQPDQSSHCNTISISPKDYSDLRKHLTKSVFKLIFYDNKLNVDSLLIPLENGLFYDKTDKEFNVEIFR